MLDEVRIDYRVKAISVSQGFATEIVGILQVIVDGVVEMVVHVVVAPCCCEC